MFDGSEKLVKDLNVHDIVFTHNQNSARVEYIIKTSIQQTPLCKINGLYITPYHPILDKGKWKFPKDIVECESNNVDMIYSLVLSNDHVVIINDIPVITLGHEFVDPVVQHEYLGTKKVIKDLEQLNVNGIVSNPKIIRDTTTNMIVGLQ